MTDRYRGIVDVTQRVEVEFEVDDGEAPGQAAQRAALLALGQPDVAVDYHFSVDIRSCPV